jgi:hypothetical protein
MTDYTYDLENYEQLQILVRVCPSPLPHDPAQCGALVRSYDGIEPIMDA